MAALLRKSSFNGRWFVADSAAVKVLMGLEPKAKWPADGLWPRVIQGVMIRVGALKRNGRKQHRVMSECPVCGKALSLGRLGQHLNIHPEFRHEQA